MASDARCSCGYAPSSLQDYQAHVQGVLLLDDGKTHSLQGDFFYEGED
jgi:hypothetical protein